RVAGAEEQVLGELAADQLQADGQALGQAARNREPGQAGQIRGDREQVGRVHRERVGRPGTELEGDRRRGRAGEDIELLERGGVLVANDRAHLLSLAVERLV